MVQNHRFLPPLRSKEETETVRADLRRRTHKNRRCDAGHRTYLHLDGCSRRPVVHSLQKTPSSSTVPKFVPSLSWQMTISTFIKASSKTERVSRTAPPQRVSYSKRGTINCPEPRCIMRVGSSLSKMM